MTRFHYTPQAVLTHVKFQLWSTVIPDDGYRCKINETSEYVTAVWCAAYLYGPVWEREL
jgi:hypothetical protein